MQLAVSDSKIGVSLYFLASPNCIHSQRFAGSSRSTRLSYSFLRAEKRIEESKLLRVR